jgi:acetyl-CoA C-acetyltransferase
MASNNTTRRNNETTRYRGIERRAFGDRYFGGGLSHLEPAELGGMVMKEAVQRSGADASKIHHVTVAMHSDRKPLCLCGTAGFDCGRLADGIGRHGSQPPVRFRSASRGVQPQAIMLGDCDYAIGGGVEVMSRAGYLLQQLRSGARMGDVKALDMMTAALTDPFGVGHMGITAENLVDKWQLSREEQDQFALASQQRAAAAIADGRFASQIVPIVSQTRKGEVVFDTDEHPRATTLEALAKMKPAFKKDGSVTAGNASGINDGAAFLVLASAEAAAAAGQQPMARLVSYAVCGVPNHIMGEGPIPATRRH